MLSEKGSLKETPPVKLLLTVFEQGLTGILYVKSEDILKVLYFSRGKLTWAISNSDADKLENILIAREVVDPDMLVKVKREARVSESIGKLLVERGLITLEELIDSTKSQLTRIIHSILKWKTGGFQFVKDAPPERLLSLDLNVTDFIVKYILEEVELSDIWKAIGSLQTEFIRNPDEEKIKKYHLSEKQQELLDCFRGDMKLESILSRHSGGHRESLLKIIYFFILSELLIKKEFDLTDSSAFEDENSFDYFGINPAGTSAEKFNAPEPNKSLEKEFESSYIFNKTPSPSGDRVPFDFPEEDMITAPPAQPEKRVLFDYDDEPADKLPSRREPQPEPDSEEEPRIQKTRKRFKVLNLVLLTTIPVLAGVILLYLAGTFTSDELHEMVEKKAEKADSDIITIEEAKSQAVKDQPVTPKTSETGKPIEETKVKEKGVAEVSGSGVQTDPAASKETTAKAEEAVSKPVETKPGKTAFAYFKEGNLIVAADVWKKEMVETGMVFSILLEMDCQKESVNYAYSQIPAGLAGNFFLLGKRTGRGVCYLVMYGKYKTREEASAGLKKVPKYFWQQSNPPEVIELKPYL